MSYSIKELKTEGFTTSYCHAGEEHDEAIIFLHGSGPGANGESNWRYILPRFSGKYQVIAPDFVGFGKTELPEDTNLTFWQWTTLRVKQILQLMDHHGIEKAHLVGNSMGGFIALSALMHSSDRFDKITLMGSGGAGPVSTSPPIEIVRMTNFFKDPTIEAFRNLVTWFLYDESVIGDSLEEIVQLRYQNIMKPEVRELYPKLFPQSPLELAIPVSALRRIKQDVLILHGYEDQFVPKEASLFLMEHIPKAELVMVKECGHWFQIEKEDRFVEYVDQFIGAREKVNV